MSLTTNHTDKAFWLALQELLNTSVILIDRSKDKPHPRYPDLIYPLDYGYLQNTTAGDGDGIDVWVGSLKTRKLTGILCTFDTVKRDAELKLLVACSPRDVETISSFYNQLMPYVYIHSPINNDH